MAKNKNFIKAHKRLIVKAFVVLLFLIIGVAIAVFFIARNYFHISPGVYVNSTSVEGQTIAEAYRTLSSAHPQPKTLDVKIHTGSATQSIVIDPQQIQARFDYETTARVAYQTGKDQSFSAPTTIALFLTYNEDALQNIIGSANSALIKEAQQPQFLLKNGGVSVDSGKSGEALPNDLKNQIVKALAQEKESIDVNTVEVDPPLTSAQIEDALNRGNAMEGKKLTLTLEKQSIQILKVDKLLAFMNPRGGYNEEAMHSFIDSLGDQYDREAIEPVFKFEGDRVEEFSPGEQSNLIQRDDLYKQLVLALSTLEHAADTESVVEIPHQSTPPKTQIADVNNLGIKELIGRGTSKFSGSIPSRIHNVNLASTRINGILIAPGETFSFAKAIGDISKYTGYKEAYIIQGGKTILGDGGGVCQVSTTLFRAVMNAGLPIVERYAHAYRVGYYEQDSGPGIDATVFVPSVDFKFKNDTGNYILIQTKVDTKKLTAEFSVYGTSDGRVAHITKPVIGSQVPPPDDLYVDDPTLEVGQVRQIEHKAWGARVTFDYVVTKGDQTLFQKTFVSTYRPWGAVFMKGTKV